MPSITLPLPQFGFVVATRAALAAGIALMVSARVPQDRRRTVGLALVAIGAISTIPAAMWVSRNVRRSTAAVSRDSRLIGVTRYPRKGDDMV